MQGDLGAHGRRPWGSRLVFLSILGGFRGRHLGVLANFGTKIGFFGMRACRSGFLKILGSESGCLGLQNQAFGVGGVAKKQLFTYVGILLILVSFLHGFRWPWDQIDDFWWLGDKLKILLFSMVILDHHRSCAPPG